MIREAVVTTVSPDGEIHIAPMGVHERDALLGLAPFRPSRTLDNVLQTRHAVVNYVDDVRIVAGCLTGRHRWPTSAAERIPGVRLDAALAHTELALERTEPDDARTWLWCRPVHERIHAPFRGFNRAQSSVLEAAILVSRLHMLPWEKVQTELGYLRIGVTKTAGARESEAWQWLMEAVDRYAAEHHLHAVLP